MNFGCRRVSDSFPYLCFSGETEDSQDKEKSNTPIDEEDIGLRTEKGKTRGKTKVTSVSNRNSLSDKPINDRDKQSTKAPRRQSKKESKQKASVEDWELDCEICGAKGKNRVRNDVYSDHTIFF